ncbi:serine hydrolase domain-containing protein [Phycicoccus sp. 3266]|uniref:serine hydrolase domain-containing protein n=1 Tax=Phycicoccus sp. 3266 TaxID=2817751 RepID=UPI0028672DDA|nr:serine hydrolase domain-containing protein [Phycicoccus sp. 3266]MDR6862414.1 CubicO group peptidase (beta-lactamase class C family) [Phycicoccus sp. 3266]
MTAASPVLPTSSPSAQGIDARGVLALVDALEADGHDPHSLLLARHGHVVARGWWAPYAAERVQLVYSLSKSFTATAVGLLVDEGRLSLDDRVFDVLPASLLPARAEVSERYRKLTLGHCLTMATGHDVDAWPGRVALSATMPSNDGTDPVLGAILAHEPEHEPGTAWAYNQLATYLAASCVREVTGSGVLDLVRSRVVSVLDPAGAERVRWHRTATGRELGFSGIHVGTDAILGLAQTYLDHGTWAGDRLLSPDWVSTATSPTGLPNREPAPNPDWTHGYGCSFWGASHGYRGDGAYGQYAIVLPEQDIALAITSETVDMQAVLDLVWEHLLPAVDRDGDPGADDALAARMAALAVPTPRSAPGRFGMGSWTRSADSQLPEAYAGVRVEGVDGPGPAGEATGAGEATDAGQATGGSAAYRLTVEAHGTTATVEVGDGRWVDTRLTVGDVELVVAASGGWTGEGTFEADLRLVETPHRVLVRTRHDGTAWLGWHQVPLHGSDPLALVLPGDRAYLSP